MAAGRIIFPGMMPAIDRNGDAAPGARAYFYADGSTTLSAVYIDNTLTTQHPDPVVADALGVWPVMWADTAVSYTVSLTDTDGAPLPVATWGGLSAALDATLASADLSESAQAAAEEARDAALAAETAAEAARDQTAAYLAVATGEPYAATSSTSLSIGSSQQTLVLDQAGNLFKQGQSVVVSVIGAAENQMVGTIDSFDGDSKTLVFTPAFEADPDGAGPYANWQVALSPPASGVTSVAGLTGSITTADLQAALDLTRQTARRRLLFKELI